MMILEVYLSLMQDIQVEIHINQLIHLAGEFYLGDSSRQKSFMWWQLTGLLC